MSLINQALKMEQQRRRVHTGPVAPMVSRAARGQQSNLPLLLIGFTCVGLCLAAFATAFLYFGSQYLGGDSEKTFASGGAIATAPAATDSVPAETTGAGQPALDSLLGSLSNEQLSTVQKMLQDRHMENESGAPSELATNSTLASPVTIDAIAHAQETVNSFTLQGIRKSGKDTRVFLNGRIQRLGDVVDVATGITLVGFNDFELVFADSSGNRYTKPL